MPTPIFICGGECGISVLGTASAGTEHWSVSTQTGTAPAVSIDTTTFRSAGGGIRSIRHTATSGRSLLRGTFPLIASPATVVARFYIYFATLPTADVWLWVTSATADDGLAFVASNGTIRAMSAATVASSGKAVVTGQWYRVDLKVVRDASSTTDLQVDGAVQTQATNTGSAQVASVFQFGSFNADSQFDLYFDDIIVSATSGDYPIGAGGVVGLYPASDGGHNFSTAGDFIYEAAGANVATSATDTWTHLQNPLTTTVGNFMNDAAGATSEYLCWVMGNLPANASTVNGVAVVSTHHSASATANTTDVLVVDDSATSGTTVVTEIAHLGTWSAGVFNTGVDLSESTITVPYSCAATGASTGAWTVANVNDLAVIFGATDVNPDSYCDGVCLEVDYVATVAATKSLVFSRQRGTARTTIVR